MHMLTYAFAWYRGVGLGCAVHNGVELVAVEGWWAGLPPCLCVYSFTSAVGLDLDDIPSVFIPPQPC
jgi:hypothetical protein